MNNTAENLMEPCEEAPVYIIGHMNPEARLCIDCDETFCAWQWNGGASHDRP